MWINCKTWNKLYADYADSTDFADFFFFYKS
jgi:hypothetical protein